MANQIPKIPMKLQAAEFPHVMCMLHHDIVLYALTKLNDAECDIGSLAAGIFRVRV